MNKNQTKTENKFIFKTHDKEGNINHTRLYKILFSWWFIFILVGIPVEIYLLGLIKNGNNPFEELGVLNALWSFIYHSFAYNFSAWEFNIFFFSSLSIALIIYVIKFKKYKNASKYQKALSSCNFSQYFIKKYNKKTKTFILDLIEGEKVSTLEEFNRSVERFCQAFGLKRIKFKSLDGCLIELTVLEEMPDINTVPKMDFNLKTGYKKLLIGIATVLGEAVYGTQKEQGKGLFNGHWLIVGGSGSGKSFFVKELLKNLLILVNYLLYKKIYIINYKGSADYNFLHKLLKVEYVADIASGLRILKKVQLEMFSIYRYNSVNNVDNFEAYQVLLIADEIQTLQEMLESKALSNIEKNSINESLSIFEQLGSKARAANITMIIILQKADVNSLPSTAFRQNLRNRIMLKQENISSAHLVVNKEFTEKEAINPLDLKQGQGIYYDTLTGSVQLFFTVFKPFEIDYEALNKQEFDEETQKVINEVDSYKAIAIEAISVQAELIAELEEQGKKTYFDSFEDLENDKFDIEKIFAEAERRIKAKKAKEPVQEVKPVETIKEELVQEVKPIEQIKDEVFKMPTATINIEIEEKEKASDNEVMDLIDNNEEFKEIEDPENEDELDELEAELEQLEAETNKTYRKRKLDLDEDEEI